MFHDLNFTGLDEENLESDDESNLWLFLKDCASVGRREESLLEAPVLSRSGGDQQC